MSLALTRRQFLSSTAAVGIVGISAGPAQAAVMVHEIAMATPGVISVEVRDPPVQYGQIIETGAPITEGATKVTKVVNNGTGLCRVTNTNLSIVLAVFCRNDFAAPESFA